MFRSLSVCTYRTVDLALVSVASFWLTGECVLGVEFICVVCVRSVVEWVSVAVVEAGTVEGPSEDCLVMLRFLFKKC